MKEKPDRYPMPLIPAFKDYLWGGERLISEFGKKTDVRPVAESWELSCHSDGLSVVAAGAYEGRTLAEVLDENPDWIKPGAAVMAGASGSTGIAGSSVGSGSACSSVGSGSACSSCGSGSAGLSGCSGASGFPILIKLIDAKQNLSLQVHPDDAYAAAHENGVGKNEAWYVIDCEPGAKLILGMKENMPRDAIKRLIENGTILDYVNEKPVNPGDCYLVPAGLIHAIGRGVLIAEVQQSSNITYRVFDYGRLGADGKPRQLHVERASQVINASLKAVNSATRDAASAKCDTADTTRDATSATRKTDDANSCFGVCPGGGGYRLTQLADWEYFKLARVDIDGEAIFDCTGAFHALLVIDGDLEIVHSEATAALKGACVFIPAGLGRYAVRGNGRMLLATI